jgi:nucleotide-binding universal stress UspA family protein
MTGPIVFPTDFSDHSVTALGWAERMSVALDAPLHCIYVVRDPAVYTGTEYIPFAFPPLEEMEKHAVQRMEVFLETHNLDAGVGSTVLGGTPFVEIIRYARAQAASMIVMSTHGYSGLKHMLMGSTTEAVVRKAACPVLSIPVHDMEFEMP